jgi:hypothetical protein
VAESPEEKEALEKLDEATREEAWTEEDKELGREGQYVFRLGWLTSLFHPVRFWSKGDPPPGSEPGLREALHEDDAQS